MTRCPHGLLLEQECEECMGYSFGDDDVDVVHLADGVFDLRRVGLIPVVCGATRPSAFTLIEARATCVSCLAEHRRKRGGR